MKGGGKEKRFFLARVYLGIFSKSAWRSDPMPFLPMGSWKFLVKSYKDLFYEHRDLLGMKGSRPEVL